MLKRQAVLDRHTRTRDNLVISFEFERRNLLTAGE
jgi:hypothetical protein